MYFSLLTLDNFVLYYVKSSQMKAQNNTSAMVVQRDKIVLNKGQPTTGIKNGLQINRTETGCSLHCYQMNHLFLSYSAVDFQF